MKIKPAVIFLTGLSGAGKTTIATALQSYLKTSGMDSILLDGDAIRKVNQLLAFDENSRKQHNLSVGKLAANHEANGHLVIVALISPYLGIRNDIRYMCTRYIEVYVSTSLKVCIQRDPKGLYKKAIAGEIADFTGISAPYDPPDHAELILDTETISLEECVQKILFELRK